MKVFLYIIPLISQRFATRCAAVSGSPSTAVIEMVRSLQFVLDHYSWDKIAQEVLAVYLRILKQGTKFDKATIQLWQAFRRSY